LGWKDFPTQADLESGNDKEVAGLKLEMYACDSKEAVEFRDSLKLTLISSLRML
jgi:hypothetical protein